jgi:hypothetical protein
MEHLRLTNFHTKEVIWAVKWIVGFKGNAHWQIFLQHQTMTTSHILGVKSKSDLG